VEQIPFFTIRLGGKASSLYGFFYPLVKGMVFSVKKMTGACFFHVLYIYHMKE